ncbi:MAG: HYR domain-containing protein [Ilumatobacter sp.]|uniref:HYR domain-containing protein n=1 Tax=Ilumatobacter sp. TaxID=1967498 RepID=UPI00391A5740
MGRNQHRQPHRRARTGRGRAVAAIAALLAVISGSLLGATTGSSPVAATAVSDPRPTLAAGTNTMCVVADTGVLSCWGSNLSNQIDARPDTVLSSPAVVEPPSGRSFTAAAPGSNHNCAILDDGSMICWGGNGFGELGTTDTFTPGPFNQSLVPVSVALPAGRTAVAVDSGQVMTCALLDDGSIACWGSILSQTPGPLVRWTSPTPVLITLPAGRTATSLDLGVWSACATLDDGSVACWGTNDHGQRGNGTIGLGPSDSETIATLVSLPAGRTATSVSAEYHTSCALLDDASVVCWGTEVYGTFGDGAPSASISTTPVVHQLPPGRTAIDLVAQGDNVCILLDDGTVICSGRDVEFYSASYSDPDTPDPVSIPIPPGADIIAIDMQFGTLCIQRSGDTVQCVGTGTAGQLGNGAAANSDTFQTTDLDSGAPSLTLPTTPVVAPNDPGAATAVVSFAATATDAEGNGPGHTSSVPVECVPASGSTFPLGVTTVDCTASDLLGNTAAGSFTVRVDDVEPPVVSPPTVTTFALDPGAASGPITFSPIATDNAGTPNVVCTPASGVVLPPGDHDVSCTATDGADNQTTAQFTLTVSAATTPTTAAPTTAAPTTAAPTTAAPTTAAPTTAPPATAAPTTVTVTSTPTPSPNVQLPATGSDGLRTLTVLGLLLLLAGLLTTGATRRTGSAERR